MQLQISSKPKAPEMHKNAGVCLIAVTALALMAALPAQAADEARLVIRNHRFEPAELTVPAGKKIKLTVHNTDNAAEEFESYELHREKVIPAGTEAVIYVGPLEPGTYPFFGDFHQDTAQGKLIAK